MARPDPLYDQGMAAIAETRELMLKAFPQARGVEPSGPPPPWLADLVDRLLIDAKFCEHIRGRGPQPMFATVWEKHWRCRGCTVKHAREEHAAEQAGVRVGLSPIEEATCDFCRTFTPGGLSMTVLRLDLWVVMGGACDPCFDLMSLLDGATVIE